MNYWQFGIMSINPNTFKSSFLVRKDLIELRFLNNHQYGRDHHQDGYYKCCKEQCAEGEIHKVQCTEQNVQSALIRMQCAQCNMERALYRVQCEECNI